MQVDYQNSIEKVLTWSKDFFGEEEIVSAREEFYWKTGKVFEDDEVFEQRVKYFWHYFILERPVQAEKYVQKTPIEVCASEKVKLPVFSPDELRRFYHGVFLVKKSNGVVLEVEDLLTGFKIRILSNDSSEFLGLDKSTIFQGYIFIRHGRVSLSHAVIIHNQSLLAKIKKFIESTVSSEDYGPLYTLSKLAKAHLDSYRYNRVPVEKHYDLQKLL